jgi:hypothetical protein
MAPLTVAVTGFNTDGHPEEDLRIRAALDTVLS